jgi:hypothetical protein
MMPMRRSWRGNAFPILLLVVGIGACQLVAPPRTGRPSSPTQAAPSVSTAGSLSPIEHLVLPAGFPVVPGARPEALPGDDPMAIASWTSDEVGPVAYAFYVDALPAAGYPTTGLFPGGGAAIIRFATPTGATWQLVLTRDGEGTRIEVRLDQAVLRSPMTTQERQGSADKR